MKEFIIAQKCFFREVNQHKNIIYVLAKTSIIKTNIESTLGPWWVLIRDIMYYLAFSFLISAIWGGKGVQMDGMDKLVFMTCGMIPYFVFADIMSSGMNSIKKNKIIITKIKFPVMIVPIFEGLAIIMGRILSFIGMLLIVYWFEQFANVEWVSFIYYSICTAALSLAMIMFLSSFGAISKDFREVILSVLRVLIYFVPIMWPVSQFASHQFITLLIKINPMIYVMEGMRSALSTGAGNTIGYTIYFWVVVIAIFLAGSYLQYKLKAVYPDVI